MGKLRNLASRTFDTPEVPKTTRRLFPFVGIFRDACYALVGSFLLQYAMMSGVLSSDPETYKAQYLVITIAMVIALIWDGFNDPIMGFIVEKVHFKIGKFKPWILIGAIGNAISVLLMFVIRPKDLGMADPAASWLFVGLMIVFYFLWDLFFTINDIGYWSMLPSLTSDEQERAKLTSRVTICASVGTFLMNILCFLLPGMLPTATAYMVMAVGVSILFLLSQVGVFFLCQERKRSEAETKNDDAGILDLFRVVIKNSETRMAVIAIFLYQLGASVLTGGIGLNYFYLAFGYGGSRGGMAATVISVMYVLGTVLAQVIYPQLIKRFSKKTLVSLFCGIVLAGGISFFLVAFPLFGDTPLSHPADLGADANSFAWAFSGTMFLMYLTTLIFFIGVGGIYMVILVMLQDSIDYNEYHFGKREESIISAWRPLDVKLASASLRLIQYLTFLTAGVYGTLQRISDLEGDLNAGSMTQEAFDSEVSGLISLVEVSSLRTIGIWVIVFIVACYLGCWAVLKFGYKTDEEGHRKIIEELEKRRARVPSDEILLAGAGLGTGISTSESVSADIAEAQEIAAVPPSNDEKTDQKNE